MLFDIHTSSTDYFSGTGMDNNQFANSTTRGNI